MKKVFSLLTLVMITLFTIAACSSENNESVPVEKQLLGKWRFASVTPILMEELQKNDELYNKEWTITFAANRTYVMEAPNEEPDRGSWKLSSDSKKLITLSDSDVKEYLRMHPTASYEEAARSESDTADVVSVSSTALVMGVDRTVGENDEKVVYTKLTFNRIK